MKKNLLFPAFLQKMGLALAVVSLFATCVKNPVTGRRQLSFMGQKGEIRLGQQADTSITVSMGLYDDKKLQAFINEKGMAMAKVSHRPNLPWSFKIVDSPIVNAFAVPGGYVYFTRGIMAHFNNEAQFAGVLGHEIGHVTARHGARQQTGQILSQVGLIAGVIAAPEMAQYAEAAQQGLGLLMLKNGRNHESESDKLGVTYSTKIGYNAHHMADFFVTLRRLGEKGGAGDIPTFLSTHPDPADREKNVKNLAISAQNKLSKTGIKFKEGRDEYLRLIDGIIYGDDPKQGFVEQNQYFHPELKFQFPVPLSWQHENTPTQFQMAPKDGKAVMMLTLGGGKTLEASAQAASEQFKLQTVESRRVTINGFSALRVVSQPAAEGQTGQQASGQRQQMNRDPNKGKTQTSGTGTAGGRSQSGSNSGSKTGQTGQNAGNSGQNQTQQAADAVRVISHYIEYNGMIYAFHGMTYASTFSTYGPIFDSVPQGFKSLSDPEKLGRQPERVRVKTVSKDATFRQTMLDFSMDAKRLDELSILNGIEMNATCKAGMLVKTVSK